MPQSNGGTNDTLDKHVCHTPAHSSSASSTSSSSHNSASAGTEHIRSQVLRRRHSTEYSSSGSHSATRRIIFPTLYENKNQLSPLCRHQQRASFVNPQAELVLQSKPSVSIVKNSSCNATIDSYPSSTSSTSTTAMTVTSAKHPLGKENTQCISNKRSKQDADVDVDHGVTSTIEMNVSNRDLSVPYDITSVPSADYTDDESSSSASGNVDTTLQASHGYGILAASRSFPSLAHKNVHISLSNIQSKLPPSPLPSPDTGTKSPMLIEDVPNKKIPGPSILRRKTSPRSSMDLSLPLPALPSLNLDVASKVKESGVNLRSNMRKSISDSCIESLQSLSLSDSSMCTRNLLRDGKPTCTDSNMNLNSRPPMPHRGNINVPPRIGYGFGSHEDKFDASMYFTRHISHEEMAPVKKLRFDPRVWVHEVQRSEVEKVWYTASDMKRFKHEAILRIREWALKKERHWGSQMISTGTGRIIARGPQMSARPKVEKRALYTSPALSMDAEVLEEECKTRIRLQRAVLEELKTVLLVDCHDIFLKLLSRDIKIMLPHVDITIAKSVEEALVKINEAKKKSDATHGFDIIFVESRLRRTIPKEGTNSSSWSKAGCAALSGSNLIQRIAFDTASNSSKIKTEKEKRYPLVIGMSAYLNQDEKKLKASGSDLVWNKPPPKMDCTLKKKLLLLAMKKRHRNNVEEFD